MALQRSFARSERILQSLDYVNVFNDTQCKSSDAYWTLLAKSNQRQYARLGLAISKKKIKNASDRNRLKRIVRESFRHHKEYIIGLDIVVLCQHRSAAGSNNSNTKETVANQTLFNSLHNHWLKLAQRCKR